MFVCKASIRYYDLLRLKFFTTSSFPPSLEPNNHLCTVVSVISFELLYFQAFVCVCVCVCARMRARVCVCMHCIQSGPGIFSVLKIWVKHP